jgi:hypothetical protein
MWLDMLLLLSQSWTLLYAAVLLRSGPTVYVWIDIVVVVVPSSPQERSN